MAVQVESNRALPCHFESLDQGRNAGGFNGCDVAQLYGDRVRQWIGREDGLQAIANVGGRIHISKNFQPDHGVQATVIYCDFDLSG